MRSRWLGVSVVAAMWAFALAVFARLPAEVPSHWGLDGQVDDWMAKMPGAFIAPLVATLLVGLLHVMPLVDPRRRNVEHNTGDRLLIANLLVLFMALVEVLTLGAALGWPVDVTGMMLPALGLLLVGVGNYLPRIRSNWWFGIRTPWTLDSERVWRETHRLGGRVFVAGGLLLMASAMLPAVWRGPLAIAVILPMALIPIGYSFMAWRREAAGRT